MVDAVRELGREVRAMPISVAGCVREDFDHNAENKRNFIIFDIAKVFLISRQARSGQLVRGVEHRFGIVERGMQRRKRVVDIPVRRAGGLHPATRRC
ncbi:hypothetical protein I8G32_01597 [Rhodopseudomonas palustris]|nr:hypothetical protein I8G32_01597 [Rhodopseudomonas palustris]